MDVKILPIMNQYIHIYYSRCYIGLVSKLWGLWDSLTAYCWHLVAYPTCIATYLYMEVIIGYVDTLHKKWVFLGFIMALLALCVSYLRDNTPIYASACANKVQQGKKKAPDQRVMIISLQRFSNRCLHIIGEICIIITFKKTWRVGLQQIEQLTHSICKNWKTRAILLVIILRFYIF